MSWKTTTLNSDLYTYDYFLSEYVCRLCWCQNGVKEITSKVFEDVEAGITVSQIIYECIGIDLTISRRPSKICISCWNEVKNFSEFRRFCHTTHSKLSRILRYSSTEQNNDSGRSFPDSKCNDLHEGSDLDLDEINALFQDVINEPDSEVEDEIPPEPENKLKKIKSETYCFQCKIDLVSEACLIQHNTDKHNLNSIFKCFRCEHTFKIKTLCVRHELECWRDSKKGYKCSPCGKFMQDRTSYEKHLKTHKENGRSLAVKLFNCKKCSKMFSTKELLKEHMSIHKNRKFVCDTCGHVFGRLYNFNKHKLMHEGVKQYVCTHCDYRTTYKASLVIHVRKHTGERPYACAMCPQRCVNQSNLRKHMRLHLGIKRFQCKICDKKYGYKTSLDEHISRVHEQRTKQHCCDECGATYCWYRDLRRHVIAKHGKQPVKLKRYDRDVIQSTGIDKSLFEIPTLKY